jgi:nucleoside-diphosphate-sugar epimerase
VVNRQGTLEKMIPPRLLVIGGSGFIGRHIVQRGADLGWQVTSIGLHSASVSPAFPAARHIDADLSLHGTLERLGTREFDYVVNLGGYIDHTPFSDGGRALIRSHLDGLLNLLEFLDRSAIKRFVQIGSSDEYGDAPAPQHEELRERPISPYSLAKVAASHFLQMLHRTEGFPAVILRLFLTYGPGQGESRFLPQVIQGCLSDRDFPVSAGEQLRDFCYVGDTVNAIFSCFECSEANGKIINVASGEPQSIKSLIEKTVSLIGSGRPRFGMIPYRPRESMALYADIARAHTILRWQPRTPIEAGLATTIDWVRSCRA